MSRGRSRRPTARHDFWPRQHRGPDLAADHGLSSWTGSTGSPARPSACRLTAVGFLSTLFIDDPLAREPLIWVLLGIGQISAFGGATTLVSAEAPIAKRGVVVGMFNIFGVVGIFISTAIGGRLFDAIGPAGALRADGRPVGAGASPWRAWWSGGDDHRWLLRAADRLAPLRPAPRVSPAVAEPAPSRPGCPTQGLGRSGGDLESGGRDRLGQRGLLDLARDRTPRQPCRSTRSAFAATTPLWLVSAFCTLRSQPPQVMPCTLNSVFMTFLSSGHHVDSAAWVPSALLAWPPAAQQQ